MDDPEKNPESAHWHDALRCAELREGDVVGLEIGAVPVAVYNISGRFCATSNVCTHEFGLLSEGWLDGNEIECPLHGGRFNVETGEILEGPVDCPLAVFPVRVVDGLIQVCLDEEASPASSDETPPG